MNPEISILKGIHPGFVLAKKLEEKGLKKGHLALAVREYPQTITALTKGRRDMNTALALKLEQQLGLEEGYFMILQVFHDIKIEKDKNHGLTPDLSKIRPVIFWDTDMLSINWQRQSKAVIKRIFERGNSTEQAEITRFYGEKNIQKALQS